MVKPADVRAAREFLRKRGIKGVSPRKFALSSQETGLDFRQLLEFLRGVKRKEDGNATSTVR
jgi:hypothetical protein